MILPLKEPTIAREGFIYITVDKTQNQHVVSLCTLPDKIPANFAGFRTSVYNFRLRLHRHVDPPLISKRKGRAFCKNKRVLARGAAERSRCSLKNLVFARPVFG